MRGAVTQLSNDACLPIKKEEGGGTALHAKYSRLPKFSQVEERVLYFSQLVRIAKVSIKQDVIQ